MKLRPALVVIFCLAAATSAVAQEMMTYQFVFYRPGPAPAAPPNQTQAMLEQHLALLAKLNAARVNVLYGPFTDDGDLRGIAILDVPDAAAARAALADDPFLKGGYMTIDVRPWMGPKGWFQPPDVPNTPEPLVFGFLMRGTNTGQSPADAKSIQQGHLAYMDELHKQGKLVAAGPFADSSEYRGLVIYRVKDVDEAKRLAAGDPAVKAGRLRIDARPWMTFKGILK